MPNNTQSANAVVMKIAVLISYKISPILLFAKNEKIKETRQLNII
jgi:hypothetical protein